VRLRASINKSAVKKTAVYGALCAFAMIIGGQSTAASGSGSLPSNLLEAALGNRDPEGVTRVVVARIDPWIDRIIGPTPRLFESGMIAGDRQAIITDRSGVVDMEDHLRWTRITSHSEGCYGEKFTAQSLFVSWAVFLYSDEAKVASIYLDSDGLCASTGTHIYNVDPQELGAYLKRMFSFMNF
jgi:hypothetical protein